MAATVKLRDLMEILAKSTSNLSDNTTILLDALRIVKARTSGQLIATGTQTLNLIMKTEQPMRLVEAALGIQVTQAANANSKSYRIAYDDGAGGADTNLTSLYDGTATAVTLDVRNAMTVTAGVVIPTGSRVFLACTTNGTGAVADIECQAEFAYE